MDSVKKQIYHYHLWCEQWKKMQGLEISSNAACKKNKYTKTILKSNLSNEIQNVSQ